MAHDIKPLAEHSLLNVRLAIHSTNPDEITDGLNEFFRPEIGEGWIADYEFLHSDNPGVIISPPNPEEGELFSRMKLYTVCIHDSQGNEDFIKGETELNLDGMDEVKLRSILSNKVKIGPNDSVKARCLTTMERITLTVNDALQPYCVSIYEDKDDKSALYFHCMADDDEHAKEQALDAYPNGEVSQIKAIAPEDYPYNIN